MSIRTRLKITIIFLIIAAVFFGIAIGLTFQHYRQAFEKHILSNKISTHVLTRRLIADDYLLRPNERAKAQWYVEQKKLKDLIAENEYKFTSSQEIELLNEIKSNILVSQSIFEQLFENQSEEKRFNLIGELSLRAQETVLSTFKLSDLNAAFATEAFNTILILFSIASSLYFLLILGCFWQVWIATKRLEYEMAKNTAILAGIGDGVFAIDTQGTIVIFNSSAAAISGYSEKEALGRDYQTILKFYEEGKTKVENDFIETALKGEKAAMKQHTVIHTKDSKLIPVADSAAPFFNASGEVQGVVVVFRDVTQERAIEQMKSDFVSLVSHQLKTPVAQIKGYVENMLEGLTGRLTKKQNEYLTDMLNVANKNSKLIDDLLNVSRIERGMLKVNSELLNVNELIKDVIDPLYDVAKKKGVILAATVLPEEAQIMGDPVKTREALRNIIDNAIKFTPEGKHVSVTATNEAANVVIRIADEGEGIDPDVQKELFEKNRVWSGKVKSSGAGLGLFLSKQFIELTGGTIQFETTLGKGTTFIITFRKQ